MSATSHKRRLCGFPVPAIVHVPLAFCFKFCLVTWILSKAARQNTRCEMERLCLRAKPQCHGGEVDVRYGFLVEHFV